MYSKSKYKNDFNHPFEFITTHLVNRVPQIHNTLHTLITCTIIMWLLSLWLDCTYNLPLFVFDKTN
jgi:hypothetical protein